jgi:hypothetical protein
MSGLAQPWEVSIEPADPSCFREVIGDSDSVLDDEWPAFENAMRCGREILRGRTVWNVNSTAAGGGVAEMLRSLMAVPDHCLLAAGGWGRSNAPPKR